MRTTRIVCAIQNDVRLTIEAVLRADFSAHEVEAKKRLKKEDVFAPLVRSGPNAS